MKIPKTCIVFLLIVIASFAVSVWLYPRLPDVMATHWSCSTTPDGFMPKHIGAFVLPVLLLIEGGVLLAAFCFTVKKSDNINAIRYMSVLVILPALFLLYTHLLMLLFNVGVNVNIPKHALIGTALLLVALFLPLVLMLFKGKVSTEERVSDILLADVPSVYSDKLIEITPDTITFNNYYFPTGSKTVSFHEIEYIREWPCTLRNGSLRLHGTGDFRTWMPADYNRPGREKIFVLHLRNKWRRIGFTTEHSAIVAAILNKKGLLRQMS